jgi:hypothetical protein
MDRKRRKEEQNDGEELGKRKMKRKKLIQQERCLGREKCG